MDTKPNDLVPAARFPRLLSAFRLRELELPNRVVMPAHTTRFEGADGLPTPKLRDYWLAKARAGTGLLIAPLHNVSGSGLTPMPVTLEHPRFVEAYAPIVEQVRSTGAGFLLQLNHMGGLGPPRGTGGVARGVSAVLGPGETVAPVAMSGEDITRILESYRRAALRANQAGFDGVEIMAEVSFLIAQFLSPNFNRRSDEFGGSLENRLRFPLAAIAAVREGLGHDRVLGIRLAGDQFQRGGLTLDDMCEIVPRLEASAELDFIHVGAGPGAGSHVPPSYYLPGSFGHLAAAIRKVTRLALIASQRINTADVAEAILEAGTADLVSMNRALLADPELVAKLRSGRVHEIRPCVACNECIGRFGDGFPVACSVNATAGREGRAALELSRTNEHAALPPALRGEAQRGGALPEAAVRGEAVREQGVPGAVAPMGAPKRVVIVGAGPAGLEAARVAALRGHRVTLIEREGQIGGQLRLAARAPFRSDFERLVEYYDHALEQLPIELQLGREATRESLRALAPEAVVIATGSRPRSPEISGSDRSPVVELRQVFADASLPAGRVAVWAGEHHIQALSCADLLATRGHAVEVFTEDYFAGRLLDQSTRHRIYARLLEHRIPIHTLRIPVQVAGSSMTSACAITGELAVHEGFDAYVTAYGGAADTALNASLDGFLAPEIERHVIGDALSARRLIDAVHEGFRTALAL